MDATPATVSKWENNKTPVGRTADLLLRAIVMLHHGQQVPVSTFRGISRLLAEEGEVRVPAIYPFKLEGSSWKSVGIGAQRDKRFEGKAAKRPRRAGRTVAARRELAWTSRVSALTRMWIRECTTCATFQLAEPLRVGGRARQELLDETEAIREAGSAWAIRMRGSARCRGRAPMFVAEIWRKPRGPKTKTQPFRLRRSCAKGDSNPHGVTH